MLASPVAGVQNYFLPSDEMYFLKIGEKCVLKTELEL